ncbi:PREDICTED: monocarboxylate transporter 7 [Cyprinodon variegatus]|uniref:Monocarboxylate transporter 7 n=1 Tax=Cyprinodon variegatus TaxID=28743 RepID=A0A3Q2EGC7_CYPVA|nr:PREDICTED: monocarboxylate transporter 7 [Cyprinodon variegatus]XP_015255270.1 PREDICTED: monocarboxylate transporter 7 [Cyprinodon variegatus]XP_015255271.1 PREDICTED: monocarboxylate transporter 7 [Cyprinodon variegatus]
MAPCGAQITRFLGALVYSEAPDGGWGWVISVAFFIVETFTYGIIKSFGIFLQDMKEEFGETNSRVSWIVSICVFTMTFNGPLSSVMTNRFGFRFVVMIGGLLISTGTIATSFTSSLNQIYITYGLVTGLGYCLTFLPTVTILAKYFSRRRSLVTALASTGESFAMFALAPAFSALRDKIGWRHTMAVIGALQSIIIICGALLRPIIITPRATQNTENEHFSPKELEALKTQENIDSLVLQNSEVENNELGSVSTGSDSGVQSLKYSSPEENILLHKDAKFETGLNSLEKSKDSEKQDKDAEKSANKEETKPGDMKLSAATSKLLDFSILRECSFILYSLFGLFATLGFFAPPLYVIELSVSRGMEREKAAYMLSTMAVAEILGRFSIGWVLSLVVFRTRKLLVLLVCVIMMTVDLVGFTLVTEFYGLAVCCGVYGFFMGTLACTHIPMLAENEVVGVERMSSAAGVYVFIQSFAGLGGPPLGGVLVDVTQNYGAAFYSCAVGMGLGAVFLGLVGPAKRGLPCRKTGLKHSAIEHEINPGYKEERGEQKANKISHSAFGCSGTEDKKQMSQGEDTREGDEVTACY